jgi:hypothetical protein
MHPTSQTQILWASILASAVVAGFVTVVIEYLAKPRLEARKERILDAYRQKREAIRNLRRAVHRGKIMYDISRVEFVDDPPVQERLKKLGAEIDQLVDAAFGILTVPQFLDHSWKYTAGYITDFMTVAQVNPPDESVMLKRCGPLKTWNCIKIYSKLHAALAAKTSYCRHPDGSLCQQEIQNLV